MDRAPEIGHPTSKISRKRFLPNDFLTSPPKCKVRESSPDHPSFVCRDVEPGKRLEITCPFGDFCTFVESSSEAKVVAFFRDLAREVEDQRRLRDFHMKIKDGHGSFRVEVYHGDEKIGPEVVPQGQCISCFLDAPLYPGKEPGVHAGECVLEEFSNQVYVRCSLDAKARPGFIVTPVRHLERMSELDDEELFSLWNVAVRALKSEGLPFTSMILNHGTYRNLPHLHLKVWVDKNLHRVCWSKWSPERRGLWRRLQELAEDMPKKQQQCTFFNTRKGCWRGNQCRFLHV